MPLAVEEVDAESFDVASIEVLIGHEDDFAVSKFGFGFIFGVLFTDFESEDAHNFGYFFVVADFEE